MPLIDHSSARDQITTPAVGRSMARPGRHGKLLFQHQPKRQMCTSGYRTELRASCLLSFTVAIQYSFWPEGAASWSPGTYKQDTTTSGVMHIIRGISALTEVTMTIHCLGVVLHHCPSLHQSVFPHSPPTTLTVQSLRPSQLLPSPFQIFPLFLACPAWRLVTFLSALSVPWSSSSPSAPASPWLPSFYFPLPAPSPSGHSASPPLQSFLPLFALILSPPTWLLLFVQLRLFFAIWDWKF